MWLYRAMPAISNLACRVYYRLTVGGARVAAEGPVLLVANHTNSLMDPPLVVVAAQRTVRFMAKSTLFTHPGISWLVKAVGSVPVYRQQDDRKAGLAELRLVPRRELRARGGVRGRHLPGRNQPQRLPTAAAQDRCGAHRAWRRAQDRQALSRSCRWASCSATAAPSAAPRTSSWATRSRGTTLPCADRTTRRRCASSRGASRRRCAR